MGKALLRRGSFGGSDPAASLDRALGEVRGGHKRDPLVGDGRLRMHGALTVLAPLNAAIAAADAWITEAMASDAVAVRLCTVPGVGPVTAAAFVATLDEVARFGARPRWQPTSDSCPRSGARGTGSTAVG